MFSNNKSLKLKVEEPFCNRSRLSIIYQILWICSNNRVSQTKLMYKANLSYFQLKKYVNTLMVKGLIEEDVHDGNKSYYSTQRGRQFIEAFRDLTRILGNTIH
ncbi:MAG: winged helix-turn-helix domain-containing protein [Candidatus Bathyarchaeota archaeon]|jgi:predicted transcriptional regulator|nr:winged helix-turn-helix domain-containing protein [Candidatus Bathyarchaeota archaeon]